MLDWLWRLLGFAPAARTPRRRRKRVKRTARADEADGDDIDSEDDLLVDDVEDDASPAAADEPTIAKGSRERDLVGEGSYTDSLRRLMRSSNVERRGGWETLQVVVLLVREPSNRFDRNAIRADVQGRTVGYVAREETRDFAMIIEELGRDGRPMACAGRVVGKDGRYGVKLLLTDPMRVVSPPIVLPPGPGAGAPSSLISGGTRVAVIGEEAHQELLRRVLVKQPAGRVLAELRESGGTLLVLLDGELVGQLSDRMGPRYLPDYSENAAGGRAVTCWAELKEGANKIEVSLLLPKS